MCKGPKAGDLQIAPVMEDDRDEAEGANPLYACTGLLPH